MPVHSQVSADAEYADVRRRPRLESTTASITIDPWNAEPGSNRAATRRSPNVASCWPHKGVFPDFRD